ncbi:MFS transporter fsa7-like isoform X2 [Lytechinus variegatus]|uniref:MFS transporter fsa7-like isoform X2 n=1 Tax=Lytechinus variegatus TaxID=7654 RepID=UPI001BB1ACB2|nr:MFS transporter fsa7-like isoform X2 [Lytechinus variegatus]
MDKNASSFSGNQVFCLPWSRLCLHENSMKDDYLYLHPGWVPTIATGLSLIGAVLADEIIKKTSHQLVAFMGVSLCFSACLVTSVMPIYPPMIFTFGILYGFGSAFSVTSGMVAIVDWFPKDSCSRATAVAVAGTSAGMLVFNPITYKLVSDVGWRNTLRISGFILLVVGYAASATFSKPVKESLELKQPAENPETKASLLKTTNATCKNAISMGPKKSSNISYVNKLSRNPYDLLLFPEFWMMFFGIVISAMSTSLFFFYWVKLLLTMGFDESIAAFATTAVGASDLAGKLIISLIADYIPFPRLFLFHIASLSGIGLMFTLMYIKSVVAVFITSIGIGMLVLSLINTSPYTSTFQVFPGRGAKPMTTSIIAVGIGIILGTVYGTSADLTGSFDGTLYSCIGAYCLAIILFSSVPLYQKNFAIERYVMWDYVYRYRWTQRAQKTNPNLETRKHFDSPKMIC